MCCLAIKYRCRQEVCLPVKDPAYPSDKIKFQTINAWNPEALNPESKTSKSMQLASALRPYSENNHYLTLFWCKLWAWPFSTPSPSHLSKKVPRMSENQKIPFANLLEFHQICWAEPHLEVSCKRGTPKIVHVHGICNYWPSILGVPSCHGHSIGGWWIALFFISIDKRTTEPNAIYIYMYIIHVKPW